jgi:hypothetical protein
MVSCRISHEQWSKTVPSPHQLDMDVIVVFSYCVGCSLCVYFVYCVSFDRCVILYDVCYFCMVCVICVLCLIVVPLPPGEKPFAVKYIYI